MNKTLVFGLLVTAIALVPTFASAAESPYAVNVGQTLPFIVSGSNPSLDQTVGMAHIVSTTPLGNGLLLVRVKCDSSDTGACAGFIVTS